MMTTQENMADLSLIPTSKLQMAMLYVLAPLKRGDCMTLRFQEDPSILLLSINLQLRYRLRWQLDTIETGQWQAQIRHRDDVAPNGIKDLLSRAHQKLDEQFGLALHCINTNQIDQAAAYFTLFADDLKRHVHVENDMLAPHIRIPNDEPATIMLREHDDILDQVAHIETLFADHTNTQSTEMAPYMAILSGTMAKHEHREEENLFPQWDIALNKVSTQEQQRLLISMRETLYPSAQ